MGAMSVYSIIFNELSVLKEYYTHVFTFLETQWIWICTVCYKEYRLGYESATSFEPLWD